ncbi:MAG: cytosolic protein [Clostridiaceae bacterium BRH_c20a]|nr:MAG: cytosolic protein [Clostridiaceae bacterium BRH_c20a]
MEEKSKVIFDEAAKESAQYILENFWILREKEPEIYQQIRQRENVLKNFFLEKMGLNLIVHRQFVKLEKFPIEPETWMGIEKFTQVRDYVLFSCLMAFLEGKNVDEQFLLSDLCEELSSIHPSIEGLDWTHYEHRKSLVRVLQAAADIYLVRTVDGDISDFNYSENNEVLYEVPIVARYFLRSFPKDLTTFKNAKDFLNIEDLNSEEQLGVKRRQRVYRKLFLTPVMYINENNDPDFLYLRNYRNRIREDVEKHTDFSFELYRNAALLTIEEKKAMYTLFPDNKAISDIVLQFANMVREEKNSNAISLQLDGTLHLTPVDFQKWVSKCKDYYGHGWSKQYRELIVSETARELIAVLVDWQMADILDETGVIRLKPLLVRVVGKYPVDFSKGGDSDEEN